MHLVPLPRALERDAVDAMQAYLLVCENMKRLT
jgi:hypothetical protein